jgi:hypothetical protein
LQSVHWDGTGCGDPNSSGACSVCFGGGHMSSLEVAETLMPLIKDIVTEQMADAYHPEFGSEWMEPDGSLYKILKETETRVRQEEARKIESLILDPDSTTPHCIDEYNAGLRNAVGVLRGEIASWLRAINKA